MLGVPTFVTDKPGRGCDFFTDERYGRIGFWVSGEVDFEVIRCDDSSGAFFEHATVDRVALLDEPFSRFLAAVRGCDQGRFSRKIGQSASRERN